MGSFLFKVGFPRDKRQIRSRGVSGGWAGWAIAHPGFGRIEGAAGLVVY